MRGTSNIPHGRLFVIMTRPRETHCRNGFARLRRENIFREDRFFLQWRVIAPICRSPNFARACGRVSVGGHPDKRPDSRLRMQLHPRHRDRQPEANRRTPRSTGDAA